jgi:hypothetical protein
MIHPNTELQFISDEIGHGVVATSFIPAGTITWVLDDLDREFTPDQFTSMAPIYQGILDFYTFRNNKGNYVLCWDNGRYVNHSFNSNCLTTAYDFEIAIRDIQIGEQLTDDYGYLNIQSPFRGIDEGTRRKVVYPDDLPKYHKVWDKKLLKAFPKILDREQPLRTLINDTLWEKVTKVALGKVPMDSIMENYFKP